MDNINERRKEATEKLKLIYGSRNNWQESYLEIINYRSSLGPERDEKYVILFLESGLIDPTANNNQILWWACDKGHPNIVELLLEDIVVDPSAFFMQWAIEKGHSEVISLLLKAHARNQKIKEINQIKL